MGYIRDLIIAKKFPEVSDSYWKYAKWDKEYIFLPRQCAYNKQWYWNTTLLRGVYEHVKVDGPRGMVFAVEQRLLCEESYIMLQLSGKI